MGANAFLIRWSGGWAERLDAASIAIHGRIEALLGLGAADQLGEVYRVADEALAEFAYPRVQTDIAIEPMNDADTPWVGYDPIGSTISLQGVDHRILAMTVEIDDGLGHVQFSPTLNDNIVLSAEERFSQAITKMLRGTLGGRAKQAQPVVPVYVPRGVSPFFDPCFAESFDGADSVSFGTDLSWEVGSNAVAAQNVDNDTDTLNGVGGLPSVIRQVGGRVALYRPDLSYLPPGAPTNTYWTRLWGQGRAIGEVASAEAFTVGLTVDGVGTVATADNQADRFQSYKYGLLAWSTSDEAGADFEDLGNAHASGWVGYVSNGFSGGFVGLEVYLTGIAEYSGGSFRGFQYVFVDEIALGAPLVAGDEFTMECAGAGGLDTSIVLKVNGSTVFTFEGADVATWVAAESIDDPDRDLPHGPNVGFELFARDNDKTGFGRMGWTTAMDGVVAIDNWRAC